MHMAVERTLETNDSLVLDFEGTLLHGDVLGPLKFSSQCQSPLTMSLDLGINSNNLYPTADWL